MDYFQDEIQVKLEPVVSAESEEFIALERIKNSPLHKVLDEWKEKNS